MGLPAVDTVKQVSRGTGRVHIRATLPRDKLVMAQTPQVFRYDLLKRAFESARQDGFVGTDEASLVERLDVDVSVVMVTPPRISGRPATRRCTSQPWPVRYSLKGGFPPGRTSAPVPCRLAW